MLWISHRLDELLGTFGTGKDVAAALRPRLYSIPILPKGCIAIELLAMNSL